MAANHLLLDNKLLAIADIHTWSQNVFCIRNLVYFGYLHTIDRVNLQLSRSLLATWLIPVETDSLVLPSRL